MTPRTAIKGYFEDSIEHYPEHYKEKPIETIKEIAVTLWEVRDEKEQAADQAAGITLQTYVDLGMQAWKESQQEPCTTFSQVVIRLTAKGFIQEDSDHNLVMRSTNDNGLSIGDYITKIGFSMIDMDYRGINKPIHTLYYNNKASTGILDDGTHWKWDNSLVKKQQ